MWNGDPDDVDDDGRNSPVAAELNVEGMVEEELRLARSLRIRDER